MTTFDEEQFIEFEDLHVKDFNKMPMQQYVVTRSLWQINLSHDCNPTLSVNHPFRFVSFLNSILSKLFLNTGQ